MSRLPLILVSLLAACSVPGASERDDREPPVSQVTSGRAGEDKDPDVAPDGRRLFYASSAYGRDLDLFVKDIGSNTATRITSLPGDERFPKVNPANPRMLAFCSNTSGEWQVYVIEDYLADPSRAIPVSRSGSDNLHPSWSPDGRSLVFSTSSDPSTGDWTLAVRELASGRTQVLEGIDGLLPEWSPAGNRIVFQRMRGRDAHFGSIWTVDYAGGAAKDLTVIFSSEDRAAINPAWSPDGRQIVFCTASRSRLEEGNPGEADDLWTVGADGGHPTRQTVAPEADWMPTWAADGRVYFVSGRGGANRIWSLTPRSPGFP